MLSVYDFSSLIIRLEKRVEAALKLYLAKVVYLNKVESKRPKSV